MDEDNKPDRLAQLTAQIEELEGSLRELIWRTYAIEQHLGLAPPPAPVFTPPPPAQPPPAVRPQTQATPETPETPLAPPASPQVPPSVPPPVSPTLVTPLAPGAAAPQPIDRITKGRDLEALIGGNWFNRIGILAIILGSGFFLKYAFDNQWIGPSARVAQ